MQIGKGIVRRSGKDVCLLAYGSSVNDALVAAEMLEKDGVSATVIDARFCKPLDTVRVGRGCEVVAQKLGRSICQRETASATVISAQFGKLISTVRQLYLMWQGSLAVRMAVYMCKMIKQLARLPPAGPF